MKGNRIQQDVIDNLINFHNCSKRRTLYESVLEIGANRSRKIARIAAVAEENWEELDGKVHALNFEKTEMANSFPLFNLRGSHSLFTIFMHFVTEDLINDVLGGIDPQFLVINKEPLFILRPNVPLVLKVLAIYIRIQGFQEKPKENMKNKRPLRENIQKACTHFKSTFPDAIMPGG